MVESAGIRKLIIDRSKEYGYVVALLELSNAGVNILRLAENVLRVPFQKKRSVQMEMVRESLIKQQQEIEQELAALVDLLARAMRNEG